MKSTDLVLVKLDTASVALAECKTAMEAKQIADIAEAARVYLERTNASVETVNRATEIRLLAERQMGEFLKVMPKNTGTAGQLIGPGKVGAKQHQAPTLRDIGITHYESHGAQKLADIPAPEFLQRLEDTKANGEKLTRAAVVRNNRVRAVFSLSGWKRQTMSVMTSWLRAVPESQRKEASSYLSELPAIIIRRNNL